MPLRRPNAALPVILRCAVAVLLLSVGLSANAQGRSDAVLDRAAIRAASQQAIVDQLYLHGQRMQHAFALIRQAQTERDLANIKSSIGPQRRDLDQFIAGVNDQLRVAVSNDQDDIEELLREVKRISQRMDQCFAGINNTIGQILPKLETQTGYHDFDAVFRQQTEWYGAYADFDTDTTPEDPVLPLLTTETPEPPAFPDYLGFFIVGTGCGTE